MLSGKRLQNYKKFIGYMESVSSLVAGYDNDPEALFDHSVIRLRILLKNEYKISLMISVKGTSDSDLFNFHVLSKKDKSFDDKGASESYLGQGYDALVETIQKTSNLR
jgi:hypothetical protein